MMTSPDMSTSWMVILCALVVVMGFTMVWRDTADERLRPGRIKCLRAPSHQILAKSSPPKARNRDKVEFATKVSKSNINCCLTMNIKKAFNKGSFLSLTLSE